MSLNVSEAQLTKTMLTISKEGKMWVALHLEPDLIQILGHLVGLRIKVQKHYISVHGCESLHKQAVHQLRQ